MDATQLAHYKKLLLQERSKILNTGILSSTEDLAVSTDDLADETDLASTVVHQQVTFNMRERELERLRAIENALTRIHEKNYGACEECGEAIGEKRLQNQPWTTLCITHAEEYEREQLRYRRTS